MARLFLLMLAAVAAALGYLMDNLWLLIAAGVLALLALVLLIGLTAKRRRRARAAANPAQSTARSREEELRALGIEEIRPRTPSAAEETEEAPEEEVEVSGGAAATPEDGPLPERHPETELIEEAARQAQQATPPPTAQASPQTSPQAEARPASATLSTREDSPLWGPHSPTAVTSLLRALWAATEVRTVVLFAADDRRGGTYTLEAALSHSPAVRREGRFDASDLFFEELDLERPLTVLEDGDPLVEALPYYKSPVPVGAVVVLPVAGPEGRRVVLVVDLPPDQPAPTERQRVLLDGFADLLGQFLTLPPEEPAAQAVPTRRAIIAEEMAATRAEGRPLALALVWRTDAEAVAQAGTVAEHERELRFHLEDLDHEAPPDRRGRIERFGELMYGVFLHDEPHELERWAGRVRRRADEDGIPLAIGIARLADHHTDADALRADAVNALQEALADRRSFAMVE